MRVNWRPEAADYLDVVAKPHFNAVVNWLENCGIGMRAARHVCPDRASIAGRRNITGT